MFFNMSHTKNSVTHESNSTYYRPTIRTFFYKNNTPGTPNYRWPFYLFTKKTCDFLPEFFSDDLF